MNIRQTRAIAAYRALLNKHEEERRKARLDAARERLIRRFVAERNGWLFAAASIGAGLAVVVLRFSH